jgi:hypothetical protein
MCDTKKSQIDTASQMKVNFRCKESKVEVVE